MKFKGMNFYKNLYNHISDIDVYKTVNGDKLAFESDSKVNVNDFSFSLLYNYLLVKYDIDCEMMDIGDEEIDNFDLVTYERMCKFFNNPQYTAINLSNFFNTFGFSMEDFDTDSLKVYSIAFNNVKKMCEPEMTMGA